MFFHLRKLECDCVCLPSIRHFVAYMISLTMDVSLPDIRLKRQVKVLSIGFSSLKESKLNQSQFISLMVDRWDTSTTATSRKSSRSYWIPQCDFVKQCVMWIYLSVLLGVYVCVRGSVSGKGRIKRTGEEWDAPFQGLLGCLGPQTCNSDPNFPGDHKAQIWTRYNYGWGLGSERSHWCPTGIVKHQKNGSWGIWALRAGEEGVWNLVLL